jgi:ubiquinone/menaquinone biosynthesis C-methylase UbiE
MSDENFSIHEFGFDLICDYFSGIERQGPGSPEMTLKALGFIGNLDAGSLIADLGCGTGGQTMTLAKNTGGRITGIDMSPAFIDLFNASAVRLNVGKRVRGLVGSMADLPFEEEELDLIWSEGAIYNMGFEKGLNYWHRYLKPGGHVAVTEVSWFTDKRPQEVDAFWNDAYPETDTIYAKIAVMQRAGYIPVASFILPENCWTEHYYAPQVRAREEFLARHKGNKAAAAFVEFELYEEQFYSRYKDYYGYVFYIGKKI